MEENNGSKIMLFAYKSVVENPAFATWKRSKDQLETAISLWSSRLVSSSCFESKCSLPRGPFGTISCIIRMLK